MTPADLRKSAMMADFVVLKCPRKTAPKGEKVRLTPNKGPLGKIMRVDPVPPNGYEVIAIFSSADLLALLATGETKCLRPMPPTL